MGILMFMEVYVHILWSVIPQLEIYPTATLTKMSRYMYENVVSALIATY